MKKLLYTYLTVDFTEWAIPLSIWWGDGSFCVEILCLSVTFRFKKEPAFQVIVDEWLK